MNRSSKNSDLREGRGMRPNGAGEQRWKSVRALRIRCACSRRGYCGTSNGIEPGRPGVQSGRRGKDAVHRGKMIRLSKVFPTLDCASCITTPKDGGGRAPREYNSFHPLRPGLARAKRCGSFHGAGAGKTQVCGREKCIGCRQCEYACPIYSPDPEQGGFSARKADLHTFFQRHSPDRPDRRAKLHALRQMRQDMSDGRNRLLATGTGISHRIPGGRPCDRV